MTPYGQADTTPANDLRIQNLAARADSVLARGISVVGTAGDDTLTGTAFNDRILGGVGNDTIVNGAGDDILLGGQSAAGRGTDTLVFHSSFASVTVTETGGLTLISGPEGNDRVGGFERYQFTDATIVVDDGSPLVDDLYYLSRNQDVFRAGVDADTHYATFGAREDRDPNAFFSTAGYAAANGDVRAAGAGSLQHYDKIGWKEGRDPGARFDTEFYLAANPDVKAAGVDPLRHYIEFGQAEGRRSTTRSDAAATSAADSTRSTTSSPIPTSPKRPRRRGPARASPSRRTTSSSTAGARVVTRTRPSTPRATSPPMPT